MNKKFITHGLRATLIISFAFFALSSQAQKSKNRWRSSKVDTLKVDTSAVEFSDRNSSSLIPLPEKNGEGKIVLNMDSEINALYIENFEKPPVLKGYRIQIYFGDLETAREVRAKCRKQMDHGRIYLEAISPNFSVSIGDYRDRWEAEIALSEYVKKYRDALITPSEIKLPELD